MNNPLWKLTELHRLTGRLPEWTTCKSRRRSSNRTRQRFRRPRDTVWTHHLSWSSHKTSPPTSADSRCSVCTQSHGTPPLLCGTRTNSTKWHSTVNHI